MIRSGRTLLAVPVAGFLLSAPAGCASDSGETGTPGGGGSSGVNDAGSDAGGTNGHGNVSGTGASPIRDAGRDGVRNEKMPDASRDPDAASIREGGRQRVEAGGDAGPECTLVPSVIGFSDERALVVTLEDYCAVRDCPNLAQSSDGKLGCVDGDAGRSAVYRRVGCGRVSYASGAGPELWRRDYDLATGDLIGAAEWIDAGPLDGTFAGCTWYEVSAGDLEPCANETLTLCSAKVPATGDAAAPLDASEGGAG